MYDKACISCFSVRKAHGWGTFPKYAAQLSYSSYFENTHTVGLYPTHNPKHQKARIKK
jgi:hypothetical protein